MACRCAICSEEAIKFTDSGRPIEHPSEVRSRFFPPIAFTPEEILALRMSSEMRLFPIGGIIAQIQEFEGENYD